MRHYIKRRTIKKRLTGCKARSPESTVDTCDTAFIKCKRLHVGEEETDTYATKKDCQYLFLH